MIVENNLKNGLNPDDFEIQENPLINSGSFGDVYRYKHQKTQKQYAIKEIFLRPQTDDEEKLLKELKILEQISTVTPRPKSLPNYYGHYCENHTVKKKKTYYIVFDLFPQSLKIVIKSKDKKKDIIKFAQLKKYFGSLLNALAVMQSMDICHRDLKPDNLLLDAYDNITIIDFGEGRENTEFSKGNLSAGTKVQTSIAGTTLYMAPEVLAQWADDENQILSFNPYKADVFSFGLLMLEIGRLESINLTKYVENSELMEKTLEKSLKQFYNRYQMILNDDEEKMQFAVIFEAITACLVVDPKKRLDFLVLFQEFFKKCISQRIGKEKIRFYASVEESSVEELSKIYQCTKEEKKFIFAIKYVYLINIKI